MDYFACRCQRGVLSDLLGTVTEPMSVKQATMKKLALLIGTAVVMAACGTAGSTGGSEPVLAAECGSVSLPWPVPNPPDAGFESFTGDLEEYVDENARVEFDMLTPTAWSVVEESGNRLVLFGRHLTEPPEGPSYRFANFEKNDDGWRASGWGGCHVVAKADGFGVATFRIDPDRPLDPGSTEIHLLANERECASGQVPTGREIVPFVVESGDAIEITVLVESSDGAQMSIQPRLPTHGGVLSCWVNGSYGMRHRSRSNHGHKTKPQHESSCEATRKQPEGWERFAFLKSLGSPTSTRWQR